MSSPQPISYLSGRSQPCLLPRLPTRSTKHEHACSTSPLPYSSSASASGSFTKLYQQHKKSRHVKAQGHAVDTAVQVYHAVHSHQTMLYGTLALFFSSCGAASLAFTKLVWDSLDAKRARRKDPTVVHGVEIPEDSLLNDAQIQRVIQFAALGHQGQRRKSGHLYVVHCIETALIVEKLLSPKESTDRRKLAVIAAILHDINDTSLSIALVAQSFGEPVAKLVDTVTRVSQLNQLTRRYKRNRLHAECKATEQELRNLLLNSVDDPLVLLIKLADRLHNMRSVYVLEPSKQAALAEETMNIWCPLAERLGLFPLKAELEDLCFAVLHQEEYANIRRQLDKLWGLDASVCLSEPDEGIRVEQAHVEDILDDGFQFDEDVAVPVPDIVAPTLTREQRAVQALLASVVPFDQTRFNTENGAAYLNGTDRGLGVLLSCSRALHRELMMGGQVIGHNIKVQGRLKSLYSIYRKMNRKGMTDVSEVYDARALRVIVEDGHQQYEAISSCYRLEGVVARLWRPLHTEADDYIANPKPSGYQSLHTAVVGPDGLPLEVQIRTESMHNAAEYGKAAHWQYKERAHAPSHKKLRGRSIPVGYPVWRVDGHSLRNGVVININEDGSQLLVATSCGAWADSTAASPEMYHELMRQVEERGYFEAGQGDLQVYLERYVRCQDNKYHRVDSFGHKHNTFIVPLHGVYEHMVDFGTAVPLEDGLVGGSSSSSSESGGELSTCPSLAQGLGTLDHLRITPSDVVAAAMRDAEHTDVAVTSTGSYDIPLSHLGLVSHPTTDAESPTTPSTPGDSLQVTRAHSLAESYVSVGSIIGAAGEILPSSGGEIEVSQSQLDHEQHSQRVNVLRQTLEARIGLDDGSLSLAEPRKEVLVMVWPTGEVRKVDHGTTAGHIIKTQGEIMIDTEGRARRRKNLVNVNNKLVPESTPLQSGDYVVLTRDLLDI